MSVVSATFQPLPTPPTTFASGIRASSMNSSLNSASPVIWRSGRTCTAVLLHVHQEVGQALVLGHVGVGARDEHAPLGVLGAAGPHLLAGDDPVLAVLDRARFQRGEVRAGLGLGEALAPDLLGREDRRQVALLLLVAAPHHQRRAAEQQAEHVRRPSARARGRSLRSRSPTRSATRRARRTRWAMRAPPSRRRRGAAASRAARRSARPRRRRSARGRAGWPPARRAARRGRRSPWG